VLAGGLSPEKHRRCRWGIEGALCRCEQRRGSFAGREGSRQAACLLRGAANAPHRAENAGRVRRRPRRNRSEAGLAAALGLAD